MAFTPADSAIKPSKSLEDRLNGLSFEEMKEALHDESVAQGVGKREWDQSIITPVDAPARFEKSITLNGTTHSLTADSEIGLARAEQEIYRAALQTPAPSTVLARDTTTGRFVESKTAEPILDDAARAELSLRFQLGQISAADYIEQSGAVKSYLEKEGIPLADLKAQAEERQGQRVAQSWSQATEEFLHSAAGREWPGGQDNLKLIGEYLQSHNLIDSDNKSVALAQAFQELKKSNSLLPNPDVARKTADAEVAARIASARSPEELRLAVGATVASGIWGR